MPDVGSAIGGGASLIGGIVGGNSAKSAAKTQAAAADRAAEAQLTATRETIEAQKQATAQARSDLAPYRQAGQQGLDLLQQLLGINPAVGEKAQTYEEWLRSTNRIPSSGAMPAKTKALENAYKAYAKNFNTGRLNRIKSFNQATPESIMKLDPGYQFRLGEGLRSIDQASAVARGPGLSGATLKELERYGSDYASSEFGNIFSRASTLAGQGLGAATGQANFTQAGAQSNAATNMAGVNAASNFNLQGANATAAGAVGSGNAIGSAVNNIGQQIQLRQLLQPSSGGSSFMSGDSSWWKS